MERLTECMMGKAVLPMIPMEIKDHKDLSKFHSIRKWYEDRVIRLAEYEKTGLTPEEIASLKEQLDLSRAEVQGLSKKLLHNSHKRENDRREVRRDDLTQPYKCPHCNNELHWKSGSYCHYCGGALEWEV